MNRAEFMRKLEGALAKVPYEEREDALRYYNEYFDDAGPENEAAVIAELGSPQQVASMIKADYAFKNMQSQPQPSVKSGISAIWLILLGVLAAPIALPLAITIFALAFAAVVTVGALFFALMVAVVALFGGGIFIIFIGLSVAAADIAVTIFMVGTGLALVGGTILAGTLVVVLAGKAFSALALLINNRTRKKYVKGESRREEQSY